MTTQQNIRADHQVAFDGVQTVWRTARPVVRPSARTAYSMDGVLRMDGSSAVAQVSKAAASVGTSRPHAASPRPLGTFVGSVLQTMDGVRLVQARV
jgi:hypothetical protein